MSKQQAQLTALVLPGTGNETSSDQNIIKKYLFHWPLFIVGVILFSVGAYYYLKVTSPVYPITATLKFKTPTSASGAPITIKDNSLDQLDPVTNPIIVENEIEVMQSKKLIYQIVKDLQLWVNYSEKKGLATTDLYTKTPVTFSFVDTNNTISPSGEKIKVVIKDAGSFSMEDTTGTKKIYKFSEAIKSDFGTWKLDANANVGDYVGSNLLISLNDPDLVSDSYQKSIKVELENKDAPFVNLSLSDQVPARGKDVLNALIGLYRFNAQQEKSSQTEKILGYLTIKVDSLKRDLDATEQTIEDYKRSEQITDVDKQADNYRNVRTLNSQAIANLDVQLSTLKNMQDYANSADNSEKLPPGEITLDKSVSIIYEKLANLQLEREQLLATTPETNPLFVPINKQILALKADFKERLSQGISQLQANKLEFQKFDATTKESLNKVPFQEKEYNNLERERHNKESTYTFLSTKKEEINLHLASVIQDSDIVDDAHAGAKKWPKGVIVYAIAIVLGLGAAAGFLFARENMNDKIMSRKQVEEKTDVPILGELSYQDSTESIVVSAGRSKFAVGEQFRVLRTNLYHLHGNNDTGRVTLFTSSVSGEGKSFVSSNLAVTLAYASRKTVILEMDLRKPKVSINFGLSSDTKGISDFLAETSSNLDEMIRPSGIPGLDVFSCGTIVPNPSELLEKEKLDEMINLLKLRYDDIIIDSPPIHLVTDSLIISRVASAALYIVRQGYTHKSELEFISEIKASERFSKFTIVFNGVKRDASGYGYYGGYGYGYSYYNAYTDKPKWNIGDSVKGFLKRF